MVLVDVRWKCLSLPLVILLSSLIFLGATIRRTMKDPPEIGVWKNNIMVVLQNGLDENVQRARTGDECWECEEQGWSHRYSFGVKKPTSRALFDNKDPFTGMVF